MLAGAATLDKGGRPAGIGALRLARRIGLGVIACACSWLRWVANIAAPTTVTTATVRVPRITGPH